MLIYFAFKMWPNHWCIMKLIKKYINFALIMWTLLSAQMLAYELLLCVQKFIKTGLSGIWSIQMPGQSVLHWWTFITVIMNWTPRFWWSTLLLRGLVKKFCLIPCNFLHVLGLNESVLKIGMDTHWTFTYTLYVTPEKEGLIHRSW